MITKPNLITTNSSHSLTPFLKFESRIPIYFPKPSISHSKFISLTSKKHSFLVPFCCFNPTKPHNSSELLNRVSENSVPEEGELKTDYNVQVATANVPSGLPPAKLSLSDQAFFLLAFIACTVCFFFNFILSFFFFFPSFFFDGYVCFCVSLWGFLFSFFSHFVLFSSFIVLYLLMVCFVKLYANLNNMVVWGMATNGNYIRLWIWFCGFYCIWELNGLGLFVDSFRIKLLSGPANLGEYLGIRW